MSREQPKSFGITGRLLVCVALLLVSSQVMAQSVKTLCQESFIEDSYRQMDFARVNIAELQARLKTGGYYKKEPNGKWGSNTRKALRAFCLTLGESEDIPPTSLKNLTPALFQFLLAKAAEIEPERVCEIGEIEASFKQLKSRDGREPVPIPDLQQALKAHGFMSADGSGEIDGATLQGLEAFCLKVAHKGESVPREDVGNVTDQLAWFLVDKLVEQPAKKPAGNDTAQSDAAGEEAPADCGMQAVESRFGGLGIAKTRAIQQFLKAGGYLTDWADGVAGPETYHALSRLCGFVENTGGFEVADSGQAVVDELLRRLKSGALDELEGELQQRVDEFSLVAADSIADPPAAECGCSRDFEARVFGFLPYWLADGARWGADFSMLDRIGIFALDLDAQLGDAEDGPASFWRVGKDSEGRDTGSHIARLINAAHRHRVEVDITLYSDAWRGWDVDDERVITKVVDSIQAAHELKFSDTSDDDEAGANLVSLLRGILPFIERDSNVGADGINLYFDNFSSLADARKIVLIVEAVHARLPETKLNLMLDPNWSGIRRAATEGRGIRLAGINKELFASLEDILEDDKTIENLLVFLPRNTSHAAKNTSNAKKLLRRTIEDAFDGKAEIRKKVLRKTVPIVITFDDDDQAPDYYQVSQGVSQFGDDLIYLQDNFAGVGLWPLPLVEPPADEGGDEPQENGDAGAGGADQAPQADTQNGDGGDGGDADDAPVQPPNQGVAIAQILVDKYMDTPAWLASGNLQEIANLAEMICQFACPNRWLFRLVFDFLAALLVIYALLALFNCRLREIYQQYALYFFAYGFVTATVFCVSMMCDPFWQAISHWVLVGVLLVLVAYLVFRRIQKTTQAEYP